MTTSPPQNAARKLVVVDDERAFTSLLEAALSEIFTFPIITFTSPLEALEFLKREPIAMLVTDYHMPGIDGIKLVQELNGLQPGVPAIIVTGHNLQAHRQKAEAIPALKAIIQKPFGLKELKDTISRYWRDDPASILRS
ncbi:MAG TPA: response regulator [Opitutaceae bacterium]|nr:response regulator [Opitutaceae bacterium]